MRSLRRWSWFSTCAHCALIACSWLTNVLYEQPVSGSAATASATVCIRALRVIFIWSFYQLEPPPPPPLLPPPNPPNPPPNPPPPPPPNPPPTPPPNGPTPLDQPPPRPHMLLRLPRPPPMRLTINMTRKMMIGTQLGSPPPRDRETVWRSTRTPSSVTPRPCAIRPMIRSAPARNPSPNRPAWKAGAIIRVVSPA